MKEFTVTMPFAGALIVTLEADNEEEAKNKFYEITKDVRFNNDQLDKIHADVEWDFYEEMLYFHYDEVTIKEQ